MTAPAPAPPDVRAQSLVVTLGAVGGIAGFLIVLVFQWTQPTIQAYKAEALRLAIQEVLKGPDSYDTLYVVNGALTERAPSAVDRGTLERVYLGHRNSGPVGFAVVTEEPGFQDVIRLIFGYDPGTRRVMAMKVLDSKETPGLGDKILKDSAFVGDFQEAQTPLTGVKRGSAKAGESGQIDMITGATISSRAVIRAINRTLERLGPLLDGYARDKP